MGNSQNASNRTGLNTTADAALVMIFFLFAYTTLVGLNSSVIAPDTHFLIICLMALTISIVYVGLQISRVAGRLHQ